MNVQLENGYTRIADELYEATMKLNVTSYDLRVLHALIRKTYGYGKKMDKIALSQIVKLTNIAKPHVSRSIKNLVAYNIVTKYGNKIGVNKDYLAWKVTKLGNGRKKLPPAVTRVTIGGNKKLPPAAPQKTITKDTITKDILSDKPKVTIGGNKHQRLPIEKRQLIHRVCYELEDILQTKVVNWGKQGRALKMMTQAGYTEAQIIWTIKQMATDEFYEDKGFDLMTVANNIDKYKAKVRRALRVQQAN